MGGTPRSTWIYACLKFDRIAGLPYAGLPIAVAMSLEGNVPALYPRKETKGYGTHRQIEGICPPGERVLVVDDVVTSGGAKVEAIAPLREAGLIIEDVLVLIDRSTDAAAMLAKVGLRLHSVLRVDDLFRSLRTTGMVTEEQFDAAMRFVGGG
jgi:uridine monophosphate synthetase